MPDLKAEDGLASFTFWRAEDNLEVEGLLGVWVFGVAAVGDRVPFAGPGSFAPSLAVPGPLDIDPALGALALTGVCCDASEVAWERGASVFFGCALAPPPALIREGEGPALDFSPEFVWIKGVEDLGVLGVRGWLDDVARSFWELLRADIDEHLPADVELLAPTRLIPPTLLLRCTTGRLPPRWALTVLLPPVSCVCSPRRPVD